MELDFDEKAGGASGYLPGGIGWYRKFFYDSGELQKSKKLVLFLMVFIIKLLFF